MLILTLTLSPTPTPTLTLTLTLILTKARLSTFFWFPDKVSNAVGQDRDKRYFCCDFVLLTLTLSLILSLSLTQALILTLSSLVLLCIVFVFFWTFRGADLCLPCLVLSYLILSGWCLEPGLVLMSFLSLSRVSLFSSSQSTEMKGLPPAFPPLNQTLSNPNPNPDFFPSSRIFPGSRASQAEHFSDQVKSVSLRLKPQDIM